MSTFLFELWEGLRSAFGAIQQNKLRATLTTLGIVIGIVMVTSTFTTINGMERAFDRSMSMIGTNVLYVQRHPWFIGPSDWWKYRTRPRITKDDALRITERIELQSRYVVAVAPVLGRSTRVQYRERALGGIFVQASTPDFTRVVDIELTDGRFYNELDQRSARNVVVIGADVQDELFPNENPVGKVVRVQGQRFEVIGVLARQGKFLGLFSVDGQVQMLLATYEKTYGSAWQNYDLEARVASADVLMKAQDELTGIVRAARGLDPLDEDNFSINRSEAFREMLAGTKMTIYGVGLFLTALALVVGGIGVMNIMFVSVKERTREIGIRKALGAPRRAILTQFLIEAVLVCMLGGLVGIALSAWVTALINSFFTAYLSVGTVILAFVICVGVGLVFGIVPAWRAARANPIEALRYE